MRNCRENEKQAIDNFLAKMDISNTAQILQFGAFSFTIIKTTKNRIETVMLKILDIE